MMAEVEDPAPQRVVKPTRYESAPCKNYVKQETVSFPLHAGFPLQRGAVEEGGGVVISYYRTCALNIEGSSLL